MPAPRAPTHGSGIKVETLNPRVFCRHIPGAPPPLPGAPGRSEGATCHENASRFGGLRRSPGPPPRGGLPASPGAPPRGWPLPGSSSLGIFWPLPLFWSFSASSWSFSVHKTLRFEQFFAKFWIPGLFANSGILAFRGLAWSLLTFSWPPGPSSSLFLASSGLFLASLWPLPGLFLASSWPLLASSWPLPGLSGLFLASSGPLPASSWPLLASFWRILQNLQN